MIARASAIKQLLFLVTLTNCSSSPSQTPQMRAHSLSLREMDRVTAAVGGFTTSSLSSVAAGGVTAQSIASSNSLVEAGIAGPLPVAISVVSQGQAVAASGTSAQANGAATISMDNGSVASTAILGANVSSAAHATGSGSRTEVHDQLYGVGLANHTAVIFGLTTATACCGSSASADASGGSSVTGNYTDSRETHLVTASGGKVTAQFSFVAVSSILPMIDPANFGSLVAGHFAPRY